MDKKNTIQDILYLMANINEMPLGLKKKITTYTLDPNIDQESLDEIKKKLLAHLRISNPNKIRRFQETTKEKKGEIN